MRFLGWCHCSIQSFVLGLVDCDLNVIFNDLNGWFFLPPKWWEMKMNVVEDVTEVSVYSNAENSYVFDKSHKYVEIAVRYVSYFLREYMYL